MLIILTININGQVCTMISSEKNSRVFLENYQNTDQIPKCYFENNFTLKFTDSTFKILDFVFVWANDEDCFPEDFINKGDKVEINKSEGGKRLKYIKSGATVVIDKIRVLKNNQEHQLPSVVYYVIDNANFIF